MGRKVDNKIKIKKIKLTIATLILLLAVFFIVVTQTTVFNVKRIIVSGNSEVSKDKIVLASGIVIGENIFKLDTKNAKENLLLHPYIDAIEINRKLPDKINIKINERKEIACIKHMNSYVYMGSNKLVLDILKEKKDNKIPLVLGVEIESPSIGSRVVYKKKTKEESKKITKALETFSDKGLKNQVKEINFNKKDIDITLNSGVKVAFGQAFKIEYKVTFLLNALKDLKQKNINAKNIYLNKGSDIIVDVVDGQEEENEDHNKK